MSRFSLVPFIAEHYLSIVPRLEEAIVGEHKQLLLGRVLTSASAYTLLYNDVPLVCGGILLYWNGVGEIWLHGSVDVIRHPAAVFRLALRLVKKWKQQFHLHRIQITVDEGFPASARFAEALKFTFESRMERYGPNRETFLRYVLLPHD